MKAFLVGAALMMAGLPALADDLSDANKALEAKAYPQALQLYQKLAAAGNAEAQFHLGEMNWYGEGQPQNDALAHDWFAKAAASGSKAAASALETMRLREVRKGEISYWVEKYDGADLVAGAHACARPAFPKLSTSNREIKDLAGSYADWQECYNRMVSHLNSQLPPGKAIPKDVADLMNQREYDSAVARLDKVYAGVVAEQSRLAQETMAAHTSWHDATAEYAKRKNEEIAAQTKQMLLQQEHDRAMARGPGMTNAPPTASSRR